MATLTKYFTENWTNSSRSSWTVTITGTDQSVSGNFKITNPTITAKYVNSEKNRATAVIGYSFFIGGTNRGTGYRSTGIDLNWWASGETKTLTNGSSANITLSDIFNANNKTTRSLDVTLVSYATSDDIWLVSDLSGGGDYYYNYFYLTSGSYSWGKISTITLNVPPTVSSVTGSYATPHYAGLGAYTVSLSTIKAYYGGDVQSIKLTVGSDSVTHYFSSATVSSDSISVTPSVAGTFTPTLVITDTRGQTKTVTFEAITVNPYLVPSVNFDVYRTNNIGIKNDEGHYGLIQATFNYTSAIANLTAPSVKIDNVDISLMPNASVAWYDTWDNTNGVSGAISDWSDVASGDTVYGLLTRSTGGGFAEDTSYTITIIPSDDVDQGTHSLPISQTLSTAFYTIDFQAGGKEIAFGAPANDSLTNYPNGLFKCKMDALFDNDAIVTKPYYQLDTTAASGTDHDLYAAITARGWGNDVIE